MRIVAKHALSQDLIVVAVARCKPLLFVTRKTSLGNRDLLERRWLTFRVTSPTFCLRRMRSINFPTSWNHSTLRGRHRKLNSLMGVAVLPNQFMPSGSKPNRKSLSWALGLKLADRFAVQPAFSGANDNLNFFGLKDRLIGWAQNPGLFGLLGIREAVRLSQKHNHRQYQKTSYASMLDHGPSRKAVCADRATEISGSSGWWRDPDLTALRSRGFRHSREQAGIQASRERLDSRF